MTRNPLPLVTYHCVLVMAALGASTARGQTPPPFFNGAGIGYSPQIQIANSGIVTDVQAWVSADRKYVTLGMRQQQASTILQEFAFTRPAGNLGFIGGAVPAPDPTVQNPARAPATVLNHVGIQKLR